MKYIALIGPIILYVLVFWLAPIAEAETINQGLGKVAAYHVVIGLLAWCFWAVFEWLD